MSEVDDRAFIRDYLERYRKALFELDMSEKILRMKSILGSLKQKGGKAIIAGNGASAAIASHVAVDFTKQARIRTVNFNEADLITCFANDYGYENWVAKAIEFYGDEGDLAIMVSSSGRSANIVNGAETAKRKGLHVVSFTGFDKDNPLRGYGDPDFWVDSRAYNVVENVHQIWLLMICDLIVGSAEYVA